MSRCSLVLRGLNTATTAAAAAESRNLALERGHVTLTDGLPYNKYLLQCATIRLIPSAAVRPSLLSIPALTVASIIITQVYWWRSSRISVCFRSAATSGRSCRSNCGWAGGSVGDSGGRSHCDGLTVSRSDGFRSSMHVVAVLACFFISGVLSVGQ